MNARFLYLIWFFGALAVLGKSYSLPFHRDYSKRVDTPLVQPFLVGGEVDTRGLFGAVLAFSHSDPRLRERCSGTKVNNNLILTAAHCFFEDLDIGKEHFIKRKTSISKVFYSFSTVITGSKQVEEIRVKKIRMHPELETCFNKTDRGLPECIDKFPDLALIDIVENSEFAKVPSVPIEFNPVQEGNSIAVVGYGLQTENDQSPPTRKYHFSNVVSVDELVKTHGGVSDSDFSIYQDLYFGTLGVLMGNQYANLGSGDSGGAVLSFDSGGPKLVGVNSFSYCPDDEVDCEITSNSYFARVHKGSSHLLGEWISTWNKSAD